MAIRMTATTDRLLRTVSVLAIALFPAYGQHEPQIGAVHFPVSCTAAAQKTFERGVALLHSFWYDEAEKTFSEATRKDPGCAMGYWGIAMSHYHPVWLPPSAADLREGRTAVERAKAAAAKTGRERDYIAAIETFYKDSDKVPHRERALAWSSSMRQLSARYPEDHEAAIFYALSLLGTAPASDKTYANQKHAAAILNRLLTEEPDHPGIAHYLIHSYDSPELASLGLPAARSYAKIAPAVPHALHMPSHIFTRLGLWQESIASNIASEAAARSHGAQSSPGAITPDGLHAMDYLVYAYLQTCQDSKARAIVAQAAAATTVDFVFQVAYALAAIPTRFALERRNWPEATALRVHPTGFPWGRFRYAEAVTHFARALGAARGGDTALAESEIAELADIRQALSRSKEEYPWSAVVEVQRLTASAWVAHARAEDQAALRWMRSAADLEDKTEKHPVTPGPVLPARELLGDLLMELNQPARALPEFESVLESSPKRFHATYGAAHSAELSGNRPKAIERYSELLRLSGNSDTERPEIQEARAYLRQR
jgi:tetratricopeptide (TPR) repeat protein